ncbi:Rib/alpha-like domain-containing protein [Peptoniphilus equinus]|uniref:Rib/alpha-like domain-containing protein n=1 Tax=Peptoniphilus equinus TaxID=3016343 RepID=A0ABY7QTW3_9FIRM|nr:Rib/alpha-like domain-containing protein [Peptoniphilus equinus]WBW49529.1 Rib/alpha-like domain-containing protein [Peptoniphilus equinus]
MEFFKKIIADKRNKSATRRPKWGMRKLSIGLVSCLLGQCILTPASYVFAADVSTAARGMDNTVHYQLNGEAPGPLRYAVTEFDRVDNQGIHLAVSKWANRSTGWGGTDQGPYNGRYLLSFYREEFFQNIESVSVNGVQFEKEADGALWKVPINAKTFNSGAIGLVTNHDVIITLKDGQTLESLGLDRDKIAFSTRWVDSQNIADVNGNDTGFILSDNANHPAEPTNTGTENENYLMTGANPLTQSDGTKSRDGGWSEGKFGKKVTYDAVNKQIVSTVSFKPNQNFLQANSAWVLYINEQIPEALLQYIDLDNVYLGSSDEQGKMYAEKDRQIQLVVDSAKNGFITTADTPQISILFEDTTTKRDAVRSELDSKVFYGALGQSRNYTIRYGLKPEVTNLEFAEALNEYITTNDSQLIFESWQTADFLNQVNSFPNINKPDGGKPNKRILNSYSNSYLQVLDIDKDGLYDFVEDEIGSNKFLVDTDGDGVPDGQEFEDNTKLTDAKSYIVTKPVVTTTSFEEGDQAQITGTVEKTKYNSPADPTVVLTTTNGDAANVIVRAYKYEEGVTDYTDKEVKAETTIPADKLDSGEFTIDVAPNTFADGDKVVIVAYSPDGTSSFAISDTTVTVGKAEPLAIQKSGDATVVEGKGIDPITFTANKENTVYSVEGDDNFTITEAGSLTGTPSVADWGDDETKTITLTVKGTNNGEEDTEEVTITVQRDTDKDGTPDVTDDDDDGDGIPDDEDDQPKVADELSVATTPANAQEGQAVPEGTKVVSVNKAGSTITGTETNGLNVDGNGNLTGTPVVTDWTDDSEESRVISVPVTVENGEETKEATVSVTVQRDTDKDGTPDVTDDDDDGDGIPDDEDQNPKVVDDNTKYDPSATGAVTPDYDKKATDDEVKAKVDLSSIPEDVQNDPNFSVSVSDIPDAGTAGEATVTVTYPDGTSDEVKVTVTPNAQPDNTKYDPSATGAVTPDYDKKATDDDVKAKVDLSSIPEDVQNDPNFSVSVSDIPDAGTAGEATVTVTYPDGTSDEVKVTVTPNAQPDNTKYDPSATGAVTPDYDKQATDDDVKAKVDLSSIPEDVQNDPNFSVSVSDIPDAGTAGEATVTVTYPDGTSDEVKVTVTPNAQPDNTKYDPSATGAVTPDYDKKATDDDVKAKVDLSSIPEDVQNDPNFSVSVSDIPEAGTAGEATVTVTYPDGTSDEVKVTVTPNAQPDNTKYDPSATGAVTPDYDKKATDDDVKAKVDLSSIPEDVQNDPNFSVSVSDIPDAGTAGEATVTVTYPDGTSDEVKVTVTPKAQPDNAKYDPSATGAVTPDYDKKATEDEIKGKLDLSSIPEDVQNDPNFKVEVSDIPEAGTAGEATVTVTYPDGTSDEVKVTVTPNAQPDNAKYDPSATGAVTPDYDKQATDDDVKAKVDLSSIPEDVQNDPNFKVEVSDIPEAGTAGEATVTVTYPDGTSDEVKVTVTPKAQPDNAKYDPSATGAVTPDYDKKATEDEIKGKLDLSSIPEDVQNDPNFSVSVSDIPEAGTAGEATVTVTYPDGTSDEVKVTVTPNAQPDNTKYDPSATGAVTPDYDKQATDDDVKAKVDLSSIPEDVQNDPNFSVSVSDIPEAGTAGEATVTVTYPDGTSDEVKVTVTPNAQPDNTKYDPSATGAVTPDYDKQATEDEIKGKLDLSSIPEDVQNDPNFSVSVSDIPEAGTAGEATVTVTYPDGTSDEVKVTVTPNAQPDNTKYDPSATGAVTPDYDKKATDDDVKAKVDLSSIPEDVQNDPNFSVSVSDIPDAGTAGEATVTVTYPDGTSDEVKVTVTPKAQPDNAKYDPSATGAVTPDYDKKATEDEIKGKLDLSSIPEDVQNDPNFKVEVSDIPEAGTAGEATVTVTYPDGTSDEVKVTVTPKAQPDNAKYDPSATGAVTPDYDKKATEDEIKGKLDLSSIPEDVQNDPNFKVEVSDIPEAGTAGEATVTVTYPDGTSDEVKVTVTPNAQPDNAKYDPSATGAVTPDYDKKATDDDVKAKVDLSSIPEDVQNDPNFKVEVSDIPEAGTAGEATVTVTYPDGTSDEVKVTVTPKAQPDNAKYDPSATGAVTPDYDKKATDDEIKGKLDLSSIPEDVQNDPNFSVSVSDIPEAGTAGEATVTVTYPDGTSDEVKVTVTPNAQPDNTKYDPSATGAVTPDYDKQATDDDVKAKVDLSSIPEDVQNDPNFSVSVSDIPEAGTAGEATVTVTYPDGTSDEVKVTVTPKAQPDNAKYDPSATGAVTPDYDKQATDDDVKAKVDLSSIPEDVQNDPNFSVSVSDIPEAGTAGEATVTVTYPDGTSDEVKVTVTPKAQPDNAKYDPSATGAVTPDYDKKATDDEVKAKVDLSSIPEDVQNDPNFKVEVSDIPEAGTAGEATVTVTYPDGTSDEVKVTVTPNAQPDNTKYDPSATGAVTPDYDKQATDDDVKAKVDLSSIPEDVQNDPNFSVSVSDIPDAGTAGEATVTVTYPDGTSDEVKVTVTPNAQPDNTKYDPSATGAVTPDYDKQATDDDVKAKVDLSSIPEDVQNDPNFSVSVSDIPDAGTAGEATVTVTYPDGTSDEVKVTVTPNAQPDNTKYDPSATGAVTPDYDKQATDDDVKAKVDLSSIPEDVQNDPNFSVSVSDIPEAGTAGEATVTVTYPDGTSDEVKVTVTPNAQPDNTKYDPSATGAVTPDYDKQATDDEVKAKVDLSSIPEDVQNDPNFSVSVSDIPEAGTAGEATVTVTYPDGTSDEVKVTVTPNAQPDNTKYDPSATGAVTPDYDKQATDDEVKAKVDLSSIPEDVQNDPNFSVSVSDIPEAGTAGEATVTVTYPDGTSDEVKVTVTPNAQPDNTKYDPSATGAVTPDYDKKATDDDVKAKVDLSSIPEDVQNDPNFSVSVSDIPDAGTAGEATVTVTYPDGTSDEVKVTVTPNAQPDNTKYDPSATGAVTPDYDKKATDDEVKAKVDLSSIPEDVQNDPNFSVSVSDIPEAGTAGEATVTVTYPDGTSDEVKVTVTPNAQPDNTKYDPSATGAVTPDYDKKATDDEVKAKVDLSSIPEDVQNDPNFSVSVSDIPEAGTAGEATVTVTYPDGTSDEVKVTVTPNAQPISDKYDPTGGTVTPQAGQTPSEDDIKGAVNTDGIPAGDIQSIDVDGNVPTEDGDVTVTVTYTDGSEDQVTVHVDYQDPIVEDDLSDKYDPTGGTVTPQAGQTPSEDDIKGAVNTDGIPAGDIQSIDVDGNVPTEDGDVAVIVTYTDGSEDQVTVHVDYQDPIVEDDLSDKYDPTGGTVTPQAGQTPSEDDIKGAVNTDGIPAGDIQSIDVDGNVPTEDGDVAVIVTYVDGSEDQVTIHVDYQDPIVEDDLSDKYDPTGGTVTPQAGQTPSEDDIKGAVNTDGIPAGDIQSIDVDGNVPTEDGDVTVIVTYVDGSQDVVIVHVDYDNYDPTPVPHWDDDDDTPIFPWIVVGPQPTPAAPAEEVVTPQEEIDVHIAYINGYPDETVRPDGNMTRAEAAAMLARLKGYTMTNDAAPNFTDTPSDWYNTAINAVVEHGLMNGYPDGSFHPNAPITRAEFAKMIQSIDQANSGDAPFADVENHWGEAAIDQAYGNDRIAGYPDGTFKPDNNITRAEAAKMLNSLFDRMVRARGLEDVLADIRKFTDLDESHWGYYDMVEATNTHSFIRIDQAGIEELWKVIMNRK